MKQSYQAQEDPLCAPPPGWYLACWVKHKQTARAPFPQADSSLSVCVSSSMEAVWMIKTASICIQVWYWAAPICMVMHDADLVEVVS